LRAARGVPVRENLVGVQDTPTALSPASPAGRDHDPSFDRERLSHRCHV